MTMKKIVIATSIPVARRFIFLSCAWRSSWRRTGGVDEAEPGTLLTPVVDGEGSAVSRVRTSTMAEGSGDPDLLIPAIDGPYADAPPGVKVTGRCLMPLKNPERRGDGRPEASR